MVDHGPPSFQTPSDPAMAHPPSPAQRLAIGGPRSNLREKFFWEDCFFLRSFSCKNGVWKNFPTLSSSPPSSFLATVSDSAAGAKFYCLVFFFFLFTEIGVITFSEQYERGRRGVRERRLLEKEREREKGRTYFCGTKKSIGFVLLLISILFLVLEL